MRLEVPPISFDTLFDDHDRLVRAISILSLAGDLAQEYRPWRKIRHVAADRKIDPLDAWVAAKFIRHPNMQPIGLRQPAGREFGWNAGNHVLEPLHRIDRATGEGGALALDAEHGWLSDAHHRTRLHLRTLMDEAAESSLIEGAATTRKEAVELLRSQRPPRTKAERMVVNNFVAMQQIKRWLGRPLSVEMLIELQGILTEGTLADPQEARRLRRPDERVEVVDERDDSVIYTPPSAHGLRDRLEEVCVFANAPHTGASFLHPIVKASILHFMIGFEHPFVDGNGRTARAVFYWQALRSGYSIFEFIPISERIRKGFRRYPQAYLDTEQDDGDLTYFILYKLDIIEQSLDDFAARLRHERAKLERSNLTIRLSRHLNLRQRLLLEHAIRHPTTIYTVKSHGNSNGITPATSRSDLEGLARRRLLLRSKRGREVTYHATPELPDRLARKGL